MLDAALALPGPLRTTDNCACRRRRLTVDNRFACVLRPLQLSKHVSPVLGLSPGGTGLALTIALLVALVPACERLGGALFNPANNAFLWAIGVGTPREHLLRAVGGWTARGWGCTMQRWTGRMSLARFWALQVEQQQCSSNGGCGRPAHVLCWLAAS